MTLIPSRKACRSHAVPGPPEHIIAGRKSCGFYFAMLAALMIGLALPAPPSGAFEGDAAVILGDNVRVRTEPKVTASVAAVLRVGAVVRVLEKSGAREKLNARDPFGYHWYRIEAERSVRGWVYGQFVYYMNSERFVADRSLLKTTHRFAGRDWLFGMAEEQSDPVQDEMGLSGSTIHLVPFFLDQKSKRVYFIHCEKTAYDFGEAVKLPALFRFFDSQGGSQQVKSIDINQKARTMTISGTYCTQDSGGKYSLTVKFDGDRLVLVGFGKTLDPVK